VRCPLAASAVFGEGGAVANASSPAAAHVSRPHTAADTKQHLKILNVKCFFILLKHFSILKC
jgi:hypothetical protein